MSVKQQRDILDHTFKLLTDFNNGIPPRGSVAPWWETSKEGTELLLDKGIIYGQEQWRYYPRFCLIIFDSVDHSNMAHE